MARGRVYATQVSPEAMYMMGCHGSLPVVLELGRLRWILGESRLVGPAESTILGSSVRVETLPQYKVENNKNNNKTSVSL